MTGLADILRPIEPGWLYLFDQFLLLECESWWGWLDRVTLTCLSAGHGY